MLCLTRDLDESIMIGEVEVKVIEISRNKVRLGVTAPKSVPVHRREVFDEIQREKAAASKGGE